MSLRELSERMKNWRCERPDEWTMDEFIRIAQALEHKSERDDEELDAIRARVAELEADMELFAGTMRVIHAACTRAGIAGSGGTYVGDRVAAMAGKVARLEDSLRACQSFAAPVAPAAQTVAVPDALRAVVVAHIADLRKCASEIRKSDVADLFAATAVEFDAACDELEAALSAPATPAKVEDDVVRDVVAYRIHWPASGTAITTNAGLYERAKALGLHVEWLGVVGGIEAAPASQSHEKCVSCGNPWTGEKCANGDPADPCLSETQASAILVAQQQKKEV